MSRIDKSLRNIKYAIIGQLFGILISFINRQVFIIFLGAEYLGLNGVFTNILSLLTLLELGFGSAIVYSMYKPLAIKDYEKVKALMDLYRNGYITIGLLIGFIGFLLFPFLGFFITELPDIPNVEIIYLIFVFNSSLTYFFSYKRSLIIADQQRYIVTFYRYLFYFIFSLLQIIILIFTKSYFLYLALLLLNTITENILISRKANKLYPFLKEKKKSFLPKEEKKNIFRNVRAMLYHKIGSIVVMGTDNILISKFFGLVMVGLYANYQLIINSLNTVYGLFYQSITASIGNLGITESTQQKQFIFNVLDLLGFWLFGFSSICLVVLFNPFIELWIGSEYLFPLSLVLLIVINFYVNGMRKSVLSFRDALGLFWNDRFKPIFEVTVNIIMSILLAKIYGISGIFLGMLISNITVCWWVEPLILFKYGFKTSVTPYFINYILRSMLLIIAGYITWKLCALISSTGILGFIEKMFLCIVIPNLIFILIFWKSKEFQYLIGVFKTKISKRKLKSIS